MPAIPILKPKEVIKAFQMLGWEVACQRGSHIILVKKNHIVTLSSAKSSRGCGGGTRRALIARAGLRADEFLEALESWKRFGTLRMPVELDASRALADRENSLTSRW